MLDKAIKGSEKYWGWIIFLLALIGLGFGFYLYQWSEGLKVTGMSRDVSWGFYIGQLTYFVGVAASGVMVVLPYYIHDYKAFGRITILGEFLAVGAIVMCGLFVMVDLGKVTRMLNIMIHPNLTSILFWDFLVLNVYMLLNIIIGWNVLSAERKGVQYRNWVKVLIYISIPWAFSIHTVTAFLYSGIPGRHYWLTAIMAALFCLLLRPCPAYHIVSHRKKGDEIRPGQATDPYTGGDRGLRHDTQCIFHDSGALHCLLQPDSQSYGEYSISLCRS